MSSGSESSRSAEGRVISTRLQESGLPVPSGRQEVLSTKKTEEWLTKKKTDTIVKKQIETRVKREIVVTEDGEIIEDSGPQVTTDTTEESKTEEQENTERKVCGGDNPGPGWILVPGSEVVSNTKKSNTTSHETREEKTDTEITEEVGGLSREEIVRALKQKETAALRARDSSSDVSGRVLQSAHSHKVVDTEEVDQVSDFRDGQASTQTRRSSHRQEYLDGDGPDRAEIEYPWPSIGDTRSTPTLASWHGRTGGDVVRITSPSSYVQRLSSPDSPRSEPWEGVPDRGRHRKTFNWVENHFGSQDLEPDQDEETVAESQRNHSHYTKRQQVSVAPSPPPPPSLPKVEMPRRSSKPAGHHTHNSTARPQYFLGDDPGVGKRFTGVISSTHSNGNSRRRDEHKEPMASRHSKPWDPKSATLGREPAENGRIHWSDAAPPRNKNGVRKSEPQSPTIADIIHSLRSKAFLEKENSAVSIRDDDSVFDAGGSSTLYRPTPSPVRQPAKRHVIKIAIKSDDSDCSSPVSSPRYAGTPTPSSTFEYRKSRPGEGIVKNAINSLLRNQANGPSAHPSLPRRSAAGASNLKWNAHLAASSPNVHKVGFEPAHYRSSPNNGLSSGSRSRSIGNLSRPSADDGYGGSSPSPVDDSERRTRTATGRDRFLRQCLNDQDDDNDDDDDRRCGRWYSPRVYADRIELPSPVPPVSPRSPPPPLTRPFSPPNYYNGGGHRTTRVRAEPNYRRPRPSSPSPPSFVRRPPSPVLPKPSSLGDDSSSNASGHSRSTNASSDVAPPSEHIESTTRRRVTTTTSRRREIELPPTDYYYDTLTDGRSMPRQKNRSVVRVRD